MKGRSSMLVRFVVPLGVIDESLELMVRIVMRVFLQMDKGFLQM